MSLPNLVKFVNQQLYNQYVYESFNEKQTYEQPVIVQSPVCSHKINLPSIENLQSDHVARAYIEHRHIPKKYYSKIFFADDYKQFAKTISYKSQDELPDNDQRIVLPFHDRDGTLMGVQGRSLGPSKRKYITVKTSQDAKKIYGLDTVDFAKPVFVTEGIFDSMFLNNAVASLDSSLYRVRDYLQTNDIIFVYDNEPRNPTIVRNMSRTIDMGLRVFFWPIEWNSFKDINEIDDKTNIEEVIMTNTKVDLHAKLELTRWQKLN